MSKLSDGDRGELAVKIRAAFKPATPINSHELFSGRQTQSAALVSAVNQNGQHAILFGERGVGKTSLANVLFFLLECPGWPKMTPHVNCTRKDTYGTLWSRVFMEIRDTSERVKLEVPRRAVKQLRLAQEGITEAATMDVVRSTLTAIGELALVVVIIDEFDTIEDPDVKAGVADTLKYLSDRNSPCTVIVIGVADDVDDLIADHQSVERCLAQVRMPRMSRDELEGLVTKCLSRVEMTIESVANQEISRISKGLPHYAHLLGLHSALAAVERGSLSVTSKHVQTALKAAIEFAHQSIQQAYFRATESSQRTAKYREVLLACAMAETSDLGFFAPSDVRSPLTRILKKQAKIEAFSRHLHAFCEEESGPVLKRITVRGRPQFRFVNTLMQPFVVIKGLADRIITEEDLKATRDQSEQGRFF